MIRVWKFLLRYQTGKQRVRMPEHSKIIHASMQGPFLCVWAECDVEAREVHRVLKVIGTGLDEVPLAPHVETVMDGSFVWHVYDLGEVEA